MGFRKVTAIIRCEVLEKVENSLKDIGIPGITVTYVKGFGDYANFFKTPPLVKHACIEIFIDDAKVESVVGSIIENAHSGLSGDGLIAVSPIEHLYRIASKAELKS